MGQSILDIARALMPEGSCVVLAVFYQSTGTHIAVSQTSTVQIRTHIIGMKI